MISKKTKYAIRALLFLSMQAGKDSQKIGGRQVSESLKMPLPFTVKILQELARNKIISSSKGPGGGFYLSEENRNDTLMDLLRKMGDDDYFTSCVIGLAACSDDHPCPIHQEFKMGRQIMKKVFEQKTIGELGKEIEDQDLYLVI